MSDISEDIDDTEIMARCKLESMYEAKMIELDNEFAYSTLRFTKKENHMLTENEKQPRSIWETLFCKKRRRNEGLTIAYPTEIFLLTPQEKKERLAYLRFRLRVIATCFFFMFRLRR